MWRKPMWHRPLRLETGTPGPVADMDMGWAAATATDLVPVLDIRGSWEVGRLTRSSECTRTCPMRDSGTAPSAIPTTARTLSATLRRMAAADTPMVAELAARRG